MSYESKTSGSITPNPITSFTFCTVCNGGCTGTCNSACTSCKGSCSSCSSSCAVNCALNEGW